MGTGVIVEGDAIRTYPYSITGVHTFIWTIIAIILIKDYSRIVDRLCGTSGNTIVPTAITIALLVLVIGLPVARTFIYRFTFDTATRKVRRRTFFGTSEVMDFADIAGISPVASTNVIFKCEYYGIDRKNGGGGSPVRFTKSFNNAEASRFRALELPALLKALGLEREESADATQAQVPATPSF